MPGPTPVSRGLLDLLQQQKRESEQLKQRHQRDLSLQQQQWQKEEAWRREQQRMQRESLRISQQSARQMLKQHAQLGLPGQVMMQLVKQDRALWAKLTQQQRKLLEGGANRGRTGGELLRFLGLQQRKERQDQRQSQQQMQLAARQQQEQLGRSLRAMLGSERLALRGRHGEERFDIHEEERQRRERERAARRGALAVRQRRSARSAQTTALLATTAVGLHTGAAAANIVQQPFLSQSQRIERMGAVLPVIGPVLSGLFEFKNALAGVTAELMKIHFESRLATLAAGQLGQRLQIEHSYGFAGVQAAARAGELRRSLPFAGALGQALVEKAAGRTTYQGERAYQFAAIRYGAQSQLNRAEAEARAARDAAGYAGRQVAGSSDQVTLDRISAVHARQGVEQAFQRDEARGVFNRDFWNGTGRKEIAGALLEAQKAQEQALTNIRQLEQDIRRQQEAKVNLAEKERQLGAARVNLLKTEQQILAQKEQTMGGAAQSLGAMHPAQRALALAGVRMAMQSKDIGVLPPFLRGLASQVAPGLMGKLAERSGLQTQEYRELQRLGAIDKGSLDQIRKQQAEIQAKVDVQVTLNEAAFAEKIAKAISSSLQDLLKTIETKFQIERDALRRGMQQTHQ